MSVEELLNGGHRLYWMGAGGGGGGAAGGSAGRGSAEISQAAVADTESNPSVPVVERL
jgi:hypothetical protein